MISGISDHTPVSVKTADYIMPSNMQKDLKFVINCIREDYYKILFFVPKSEKSESQKLF